MRARSSSPIVVTLATLLGVACGGTAPSIAPPPGAQSSGARPAAPFDYVGQSWLRFDATVADTVATRLILDTGGGVTLLSATLCARVGCVADGTYTGKRMSGQALVLPMARVSSLVVAGHRVTNLRVAVLDTTTLLHPDLGVDGFVGLDAFRGQPFTIDYAARTLVLEDDASLAARRSVGRSVRVRVDDDGTATEVYLPLALGPDAAPLAMEVDTGSRDLILDARFMEPLGVAPGAPGVERVDGKDETDEPYVRYFSALPRAVAVAGAPDVAVPAGARVMFQRIIHDGLVGHTFLSARTTTFDLGGQTMIFARPP